MSLSLRPQSFALTKMIDRRAHQSVLIISFRFFGKINELESKVPTADEESKLSTVPAFIHSRYGAQWRTMVFNVAPELFANVAVKSGQDEPVEEARNKVLSPAGAVLILLRYLLIKSYSPHV